MKKKLPLIILETLEKYVNLKGRNFEMIKPSGFLLCVVDKDRESGFYFNIEEYQMKNGLKLLIDYKPANKNTTANERTWHDIRSLDGLFEKWVNFLDDYEKVQSFYDDPILKSYAADYYAEFEIIEENAESEPLKPNQILLLDEHLEYIEKNIDKYKTDNNEPQIDKIKKEVIELRENLTSNSKAWVIGKLSLIWGRLTKQGTKFLKEFISEAKKQAIKEGIKFIIEQGPNLIN